MRHLGSILLSVVLAAIIYVLAGVGFVRVAQGLDQAKFGTDAIIGALLLIAAGALYALLAQARLSPLGPILVGLVYLVVGVWALTSLHSLTKLLPKGKLLGAENWSLVPLSGVTLMLAVPLLFTVISPRRWRRYATPRPAPTAAAPAGAPYPGPSGYSAYPPPAPAYGSPYSSPISGGPSSDAGMGYSSPDSAPPASSLPQPSGPYSPQLGSYAPPSSPPPAPLWPGNPPSHLSGNQEPPDPESTRRL